MNGILENKRQAIAQACRRHGVIRLDGFGSARSAVLPSEAIRSSLIRNSGPEIFLVMSC